MLPLVWVPYSDTNSLTAVGRLREILLSWQGTPYREGQQCKGYGTDCVRFVCGVLDELDGAKRSVVTLPSDTALHAPETARSSMRLIMKMFAPHNPVIDGTAQPGDVLITGPRHGGPGHAMIVGFNRNTIWESTSPCVQRVGWSLDGNLHNKLFRVLRMVDRSERWVKTAEH